MTTTATKPAAPRGKKPDDHKQSNRAQHEQRLERDRLLHDMPELVPPHKLRMRDRARFNAIMLDVAASGLFDSNGVLEIDTDAIDAKTIEQLKGLDDLCAKIDEFAESIAVDPEAYAEWSGGKGYDVFTALLELYNESLGESNGS